MAGFPTLQVLLDDGTGTFPYDITSKCRLQYDVKRGRQNELTDVVPGTLDIIADNTDGRFTLGSTIIASPSPIKLDAQIRLKVTANATTVNRHTGYVQSWPVEWPTGAQTLSEVKIGSIDAQARADGRTLLSVIEEEIFEDGPALYYTLGDPSIATTASETSGNQGSALTQVDAQVGGTGTPVTFGSDTGPTTDGLTAAHFAGFNSLVLGTTIPFAMGGFEFYFATTSGGAAGLLCGTAFSLNGTAGIGLTTGTLFFGTLAAPGLVNDGLVHHVAVTIAGGTATCYLDGALVGTTAATVTAGGSLFVGGGLGVPPMLGSEAHVAVYAAAAGLSAARALAHATAGLTGFDGESGTARITRTAGYANVPVGTLDTSLTNVAYEDITGKSAGEALRDVEDAEMGTLFVNGSGAYEFHNRQRVVVKSAPDVTIDANQLAEDTQFAVDMQGVINYFEATSQKTQARQVARSTSSEATHGRYPTSKTYLVRTDGEALDRANWILNAHAEPAPRVGTLKIDMLTLTAAQQAALLAAEADTWIRVINLPSQTPGGTTADLVVQGFQDTLTLTSWVLTANVVSKPTIYPSVWILGDSTYGVLGSTTRLGV